MLPISQGYIDLLQIHGAVWRPRGTQGFLKTSRQAAAVMAQWQVSALSCHYGTGLFVGNLCDMRLLYCLWHVLAVRQHAVGGQCGATLVCCLLQNSNVCSVFCSSGVSTACDWLQGDDGGVLCNMVCAVFMYCRWWRWPCGRLLHVWPCGGRSNCGMLRWVWH